MLWTGRRHERRCSRNNCCSRISQKSESSCIGILRRSKPPLVEDRRCSPLLASLPSPNAQDAEEELQGMAAAFSSIQSRKESILNDVEPLEERDATLVEQIQAISSSYQSVNVSTLISQKEEERIEDRYEFLRPLFMSSLKSFLPFSFLPSSAGQYRTGGNGTFDCSEEENSSWEVRQRSDS